MNNYYQIGGGYWFAWAGAGLVVRAPNGQETYFQPGDCATAMRDSIESLDEISIDVTDAKRGTIADMLLGEYFA